MLCLVVLEMAFVVYFNRLRCRYVPSMAVAPSGTDTGSTPAKSKDTTSLIILQSKVINSYKVFCYILTIISTADSDFVCVCILL